MQISHFPACKLRKPRSAATWRRASATTAVRPASPAAGNFAGSALGALVTSAPCASFTVTAGCRASLPAAIYPTQVLAVMLISYMCLDRPQVLMAGVATPTPIRPFNLMLRYITLLNFTDKGSINLKESTSRAHDFGAILKA